MSGKCFTIVITDKVGTVVGFAGIDTLEKKVKIVIGKNKYTTIIQPNSWYGIKNGAIKLIRKVAFDYPYIN